MHGTLGKEPVFALVARKGKVRSFHLADVKGDTLREIVRAHLDDKTIVYIDNNHTTQCQQHLKRYLAEFDFRHTERAALGVDDVSRTVLALKGAHGKRLTYRRARASEASGQEASHAD